MIAALASPVNRRRTLILLAIGLLFALAGAIVGVSDNPPGIALAFGSAGALVLAFTHPWRTFGPWFRLFVASLLGFVASALLHNVFEALAGLPATPGLLRAPFNVFGVIFFLLAVLAAPPAIVIGVIGMVVTAASRLGRSHHGRSLPG